MEDDRIAQLQELAKKLKKGMRAGFCKPPRAKCLERPWRLQMPRWELKHRNRCLPLATGQLASQPQKGRMRDYKLT